MSQKRTNRVMKQFNGVIVWLDVDDVLVNFMKRLNYQINWKWGTKLGPDFIPNNIGYSDILSSRSFDFIMNSLPESWPEDLEVFKGAAALTRQLKKLGCRIILITSIFTKSASYRIRNMVQNGIEFDEAYFTKGVEKGKFAKELVERFRNKDGSYPVSIFVDDMLRNCLEFLDSVPESRAFSLSHPYNAETIAKIHREGLDPMVAVYCDIPSLYKAVVKAVKKA